MIKHDVRKIQPDESVAIDTTVEIAMPRGFDATDTAVAVVGRLKNAGGGHFELDLDVRCQFAAVCSRCLMPVEHKLSFHVNERFVEDEGLSVDEGEDFGFSDHTIDIFPAVQRNLLLNMPMKSLCDEDCAGLCKQCGKNLNEGDCGCEGEIVNEQFRDLLQHFSD